MTIKVRLLITARHGRLYRGILFPLFSWLDIMDENIVVTILIFNFTWAISYKIMKEFPFQWIKKKKRYLNVYRDEVLVWGLLNSIISVVQMLNCWCLFGIVTVPYLDDVCYTTCTVVTQTHYGWTSDVPSSSSSSDVSFYARQLIPSVFPWLEPPIHIYFISSGTDWQIFNVSLTKLTE